MLVSQILRSKSDDGVVTLPPETMLGKVAELLSSRRIGTVVISVDGKVVLGILSDIRFESNATLDETSGHLGIHPWDPDTGVLEPTRFNWSPPRP